MRASGAGADRRRFFLSFTFAARVWIALKAKLLEASSSRFAS
jgi:hypothetical protein